ncbi:MAG: helix-turn-helix transcriptional regulator [Bacteroidales bacterium]
MELSNEDKLKLKGKPSIVVSLVEVLTKGVNQLINGECDESESSLKGLADYAKNFVCPERHLSKYEAAKYLKCCTRQFDRYISEGKIPKGKSQAGFKELSWLKKDLDKFLKSKEKDS